MSWQLISILGCDNKSLTISVWPPKAARIIGVQLNVIIEIPKKIKIMNFMKKEDLNVMKN